MEVRQEIKDDLRMFLNNYWYLSLLKITSSNGLGKKN